MAGGSIANERGFGNRPTAVLPEEDRFDVWAPSTVLKIPLGERWKVHAEYGGVFSDDRADETVQHFFSPGAHYLITPDY